MNTGEIRSVVSVLFCIMSGVTRLVILSEGLGTALECTLKELGTRNFARYQSYNAKFLVVFLTCVAK